MANNSYAEPENPNRAELFRNARPPQERFGRGDMDNPDEYQTHAQEDEDDEVEAVKVSSCL